MAQKHFHKLVFERPGLSWRSQPIPMEGDTVAQARVRMLSLGRCSAITFRLFGTNDGTQWVSIGPQRELNGPGTHVLEKLTDLSCDWIRADFNPIGVGEATIDAAVTTWFDPKRAR